MPKLLGLMLLTVTSAVACGQSDGNGKAAVGSSGSSSGAGLASAGQTNAAGGGGSAAGAGGKAPESGSAGQGRAGSSAGLGGAAGAGEGGGSDGGTAGERGAGTDARPGCEEAALIELSHLRLVEGAGPGGTAVLEVEAKNGSSDFVSHNPVKISCTGDALAQARDRLVFFGILAGESSTVTLEVDFKDTAQAGDVVSCTVRGAISGKSPDDCANAQTESTDVTVE